MSNSLAQTRGGLQYPNNNPVAAHVHMHTLNHHTLTTSSVECPPGLFRRFQHKLLRPKIVQHWAPIKRKAGYSYYRKPSSHSHLATTASSSNKLVPAAPIPEKIKAHSWHSFFGSDRGRTPSSLTVNCAVTLRPLWRSRINCSPHS